MAPPQKKRMVASRYSLTLVKLRAEPAAIESAFQKERHGFPRIFTDDFVFDPCVSVQIRGDIELVTEPKSPTPQRWQSPVFRHRARLNPCESPVRHVVVAFRIPAPACQCGRASAAKLLPDAARDSSRAGRHAGS